jgi:hypothetical protein
MRTTILAFGIALVGLIMIAVGVWSLLVLEAEETVLFGGLLNRNRNNSWRPCHGWPCPGLASAT